MHTAVWSPNEYAPRLRRRRSQQGSPILSRPVPPLRSLRLRRTSKLSHGKRALPAPSYLPEPAPTVEGAVYLSASGFIAKRGTRLCKRRIGYRRRRTRPGLEHRQCYWRYGDGRIVIEEGAVLRGKVEVRQKGQPPQPPRSAVPAHAKEAVATDSAQAKQQAMEVGARREV